jgi:hypothetical protein
VLSTPPSRASRGSNAQIDVSFERNAAGDAEAAVTVRHLRGFVVPSILYAVQGFFTSVATSAASRWPLPSGGAAAMAVGAAGAAPLPPPSRLRLSACKKRTPTLLAVVKIERPQLFVLEDETSSESSAVELFIGRDSRRLRGRRAREAGGDGACWTSLRCL